MNYFLILNLKTFIQYSINIIFSIKLIWKDVRYILQ